MFSSQISPFLSLATRSVSVSLRGEVSREFESQFATVSSEVEFDLLLWSLAQRLRVDTEELLRKVGGAWFRELPLFEDLVYQSEKGEELETLRDLFVRRDEVADAPLPGMGLFRLESVDLLGDRLRIECEGARRCCSFLEGMARSLCEELGVSLRYLRQPKRATFVVMTFSCIQN